MGGPTDRERLEALSRRIEQAKGADKPRPRIEDHHRQAQLGWRMVIELVSGIVIGFGIGYGLDVLLGTLPIFLVLFVLLGFAAGVRVMLRSAEEAREQGAAGAAEKDEGT